MRAQIRSWVLLLLLAAGTAGGTDLRILIPLYSYPNWWQPATYLWPRVAQAGARVPITAIIDPDNGPGTNFPNSDYTHGMADLAAGGVQMVGYVYTSYGARSAALVRADIALYTNSPLVTGIFLDECASGTNQLAYYQELYAYILARTNFTTVLVNPGTQIAEGYIAAPACDTAVIFENDTGWTNYTADAYVTNHPAGRFAMLVYACGGAEAMRTNVDLAAQRNVGWVYVTDDGGANPWDTVCTYWSNLVDHVAAYRSLRVTTITAGSNGVNLSCSTVSNRPARVEWSAALPATNWTPATATTVPTGTVLQATDTNVPAGTRFYRLRVGP